MINVHQTIAIAVKRRAISEGFHTTRVMHELHMVMVSLLCLMALTALTSCSGSSDGKSSAVKGTEADSADSTFLRIALVPTSGTLPFYYAESMGMLDSIKIYTYSSQADCDTALLSGHVEGAFSDVVRLVYMVSRGADARVVMRTDDDWQLVLAKQLRSDKVSVLKGKTIATERFSASDAVATEALKQAKMSYSDAFHPQINGLTIRRQMVDGYQVDAAVLPRPYSDASVARGARLAYSSVANKDKMGCIAFLRTTLTEQPKRRKIEELIKAYDKAVEQLANPDKKVCDSLYINVYGLDTKETDNLRIPAYEKARQVRMHDMKEAALWLGTMNVNTAKVDLNGIINTTFTAGE